MKKTPGENKGVSVPERMLAEVVVAIDKRLDEIAQHIDNMEVELTRLRTGLDITKLLKHIVSETGKPVSSKLIDIPEADYYATIRSNAERFGYRIQELNEAKQRLFTMQNSNVLDDVPAMAKALKESLVPVTMGKKDVLSFLVEDTLNLIEILEQADEEVRAFDALCKLIQALPEEEKDKIRNA